MKNKINAIEELYISCMNCTNTEKECKGIWKDFAKGIPPRGFKYNTVPVKILVVSKNPGHPLKGEPEKYIGKSGMSLYQAYRQHQIDTYYNLDKIKDRSLVFHRNLFRYISFFLDKRNSIDILSLNNKDIFSRKNIDIIYQVMSHTNLMKCSTTGERDRLDKTTMKVCSEKYLLDEIRLLRPKVLLALGGEVATFLNRMKKEYELPPVIRIKHPSYFYRKEIEYETLLQIKDQINQYL